jgi:hypothetical protein
MGHVGLLRMSLNCSCQHHRHEEKKKISSTENMFVNTWTIAQATLHCIHIWCIVCFQMSTIFASVSKTSVAYSRNKFIDLLEIKCVDGVFTRSFEIDSDTSCQSCEFNWDNSRIVSRIVINDEQLLIEKNMTTALFEFHHVCLCMKICFFNGNESKWLFFSSSCNGLRTSWVEFNYW